MDYQEFKQKFTDEYCINHYIKLRYKGELICPHCGSKTKIYRFKKRPRICQCKIFNNTFSVFRDTIFEKSRTSLKKWLYIIRLCLNAKKGVTLKQIRRETRLTQKCAWDLRRKIKKAMDNPENKSLFENIAKIEEENFYGKS
jgi:hypothetical protein